MTNQGGGERQCIALTKHGDRTRCRRRPVVGSDYCANHGGGTTDAPAHWNETRNRCTGITKSGAPCKRWATTGQTVCQRHGAEDAKPLKVLAREKLFDLLPESLQQLHKIISSPTTKDADRLRAIELVLNRTGFGPSATLEVDAPAWEDVVAKILVDVPADFDPARVIDAEATDAQIEYDHAIEAARPDADVISLRPDQEVV